MLLLIFVRMLELDLSNCCMCSSKSAILSFEFEEALAYVAIVLTFEVISCHVPSISSTFAVTPRFPLVPTS